MQRVRVELTSEVFQTPAVTTLAISAYSLLATATLLPPALQHKRCLLRSSAQALQCLRVFILNPDKIGIQWARMESNHRLPSYKDGTLTAELLALSNPCPMALVYQKI